MANDWTNVTPQILAQALVTLRQKAYLPRIVNRGYDDQAAKKGATIDIPIPSAITAIAVTPSNVLPATTDLTPSTVAVTLDQWYEAPFDMTDKEALEVMEGVKSMCIEEAAKSLANKINDSIFGLYPAIYNYVGTAGTTPFGSDLVAATSARKVLEDNATPDDPRAIIIDPAAEANVLNLRQVQDATFGGSNQGLIEGRIGRKLGFDWFMHQRTPTHTKGAAGTILVDNGAGYAAGISTVHMDGATTKPSVGDILTFAGHSQTYTVVSSTTLVGTDTDVVISPALQAAVVDDEAVTFKATHVVNLAMHRDALVFASRPLSSVVPAGLGVIVDTITDADSGLTLRLEIQRQFKQNRVSLDILWGVKAVRPELAVRIAG